MAPCRERLDGGPQGIRPNDELRARVHDRLPRVRRQDDLEQRAVGREDEVEDRAERPLPSPHGEAAHRGERPAAIAVEVELLAHEDERRGDGDRDVTDLARDERKVAVSAVAAEDIESHDARAPPDLARDERKLAVSAVAAEDVESEHARQSVVEKDVHDYAEAAVGVTDSPAFDGAEIGRAHV